MRKNKNTSNSNSSYLKNTKNYPISNYNYDYNTYSSGNNQNYHDSNEFNYSKNNYGNDHPGSNYGQNNFYQSSNYEQKKIKSKNTLSNNPNYEPYDEYSSYNYYNNPIPRQFPSKDTAPQQHPNAKKLHINSQFTGDSVYNTALEHPEEHDDIPETDVHFPKSKGGYKNKSQNKNFVRIKDLSSPIKNEYDISNDDYNNNKPYNQYNYYDKYDKKYDQNTYDKYNNYDNYDNYDQSDQYKSKKPQYGKPQNKSQFQPKKDKKKFKNKPNEDKNKMGKSKVKKNENSYSDLSSDINNQHNQNDYEEEQSGEMNNNNIHNPMMYNPYNMNYMIRGPVPGLNFPQNQFIPMQHQMQQPPQFINPPYDPRMIRNQPPFMNFPMQQKPPYGHNPQVPFSQNPQMPYGQNPMINPMFNYPHLRPMHPQMNQVGMLSQMQHQFPNSMNQIPQISPQMQQPMSQVPIQIIHQQFQNPQSISIHQPIDPNQKNQDQSISSEAIPSNDSNKSPDTKKQIVPDMNMNNQILHNNPYNFNNQFNQMPGQIPSQMMFQPINYQNPLGKAPYGIGNNQMNIMQGLNNHLGNDDLYNPNLHNIINFNDIDAFDNMKISPTKEKQPYNKNNESSNNSFSSEEKKNESNVFKNIPMDNMLKNNQQYYNFQQMQFEGNKNNFNQFMHQKDSQDTEMLSNQMNSAEFNTFTIDNADKRQSKEKLDVTAKEYIPKSKFLKD